jgi:hypothetical protein
MVTLSLRQFTWNRDGRQLIAEDSSLGSNYLGQVYPDSADVGFRVVSMYTGIEVVFVREVITRDGQGDVIACFYNTYRDANRHLTDEQWARVEGLTAIIFND